MLFRSPGAACSAAPVAQLLNQLICYTNAPAIVLLSSDAALEPRALQQLCAALASDPELALVAPAAHAVLPAATLAVRTVTSACLVSTQKFAAALRRCAKTLLFMWRFGSTWRTYNNLRKRWD